MSAAPKFLIIALACALLAPAAYADGPGRGGRGNVGKDPSLDSNNRIDLHKRYPGDVNFGPGNARLKGPDKGVYIERCYWTANNTLLGLPLGFTQRCQRHTLQNTQ